MFGATQGPRSEVLSDKFRIQIKRCDIATLTGLEWLNDEVPPSPTYLYLLSSPPFPSLPPHTHTLTHTLTHTHTHTLTHTLTHTHTQIINFYFQLIAERSRVDMASTEQNHKINPKKVHVMSSFFYPKLVQTGYSGVRRWTRKVRGNPFRYPMINDLLLAGRPVPAGRGPASHPPWYALVPGGHRFLTE